MRAWHSPLLYYAAALLYIYMTYALSQSQTPPLWWGADEATRGVRLWLYTNTLVAGGFLLFAFHGRGKKIFIPSLKQLGMVAAVGAAAIILCAGETASLPLLALLMLASMAWSLRGFRLSSRFPLSPSPRLSFSMSPLSGDKRNSLRLTPMQEQLVGLLMSAPERRMSKQDICQALWPGKPDASETLYTLVRRTKQALEPEGRIRIASERGRSYRIEVG